MKIEGKRVFFIVLWASEICWGNYIRFQEEEQRRGCGILIKSAVPPPPAPNEQLFGFNCITGTVREELSVRP